MTTSDDMARELWLTPGLPESGRRRYAAAMWFHARGMISPAALEVFRVLAPCDGDDPMLLLDRTDLPPPVKSSPEALITTLVANIVAAIGPVQGHGVHETRSSLASVTGTPVATRTDNTVVTDYMQAALDRLALTHPDLAASIGRATPYLPWQTYDEYPVAEVGARFPSSHAFCSILGETQACWTAEGLDIGLFLMAPRLLYRDHAHPAPELYLPLTGPHGWRFKPGAPFATSPAFAPVWIDPETPHATLVGDDPFLCLYAWLAHPQAPAWIVPADDWEQYEP